MNRSFFNMTQGIFGGDGATATAAGGIEARRSATPKTETIISGGRSGGCARSTRSKLEAKLFEKVVTMTYAIHPMALRMSHAMQREYCLLLDYFTGTSCMFADPLPPRSPLHRLHCFLMRR